MTCPACFALFEPLREVHGLTICPQCMASLVVATGKRATEADTVAVLEPDDLKALKALRAELRKAKGQQ